jgi:hypothetical protein
MTAAPFRWRLWLAGAFLASTLAGGCDLNPQPLPPLSDEGTSGDDGGASFSRGGSSSSSGMGASSGGAGTSSGFGPPAGQGSGRSPAADAGALAPPDAAEAEGGDAAIDAAAEAGTPNDSGTQEPSPDAANDGESARDAGCLRPRDCYMSHPGKCFLCTWPLNFPVCVEGRCVCACEERDAAEEQ